MKAVGIIVFAVLGVGLLLTPLISEHVRQARAAQLLESRRDLKEVNLGAGMGQEYRMVCWGTGGLMILIAAAFGAEPGREGRRGWGAAIALVVLVLVIAVSLTAGYFLWTSG
jgi:hypothetical protein